MSFLSSPVYKNRVRLSLTQLESREVPSAVPTVQEQVFLERLNDARANPAAYGQQIGVDLSYIAPSAPLAFDIRLVEAARLHSQDMNNNRFFSHTGSDGASPFTRMTRAGYSYRSAGESIAAGYSTVDSALAGLVVDAGVPSLGHRHHLLAYGSGYQHREVGIGVVQNGTGPYRNYYTIDSGTTSDARPYLTGVVYRDANGNRKYDAGEGLSGVTVSAGGSSVSTWSTGGYSLRVNPGQTYTVNVSGTGLSSPYTQSVTVGTANVRFSVDTAALGGGTTNRPPTLTQPGNVTTTGTTPVSVTLSASDPDGNPLTYSATVKSEAYQLDQQYGLSLNGSHHTNLYGRNEKWLYGNTGWFFILPNGELYQRPAGVTGANGNKIATLPTAYYTDPSKLYNATLGATVSVSGNRVTVTPTAGFVGRLFVTATVSDGLGGTDTKTFEVTVS